MTEERHVRILPCRVLRWKIFQFFLGERTENSLADDEGSLHVHRFLVEEQVAIPFSRTPLHFVARLLNHFKLDIAVLVEKFLVRIKGLCNHADGVLDGICLSPTENEGGKVHVWNIPCTAIEVSLAGDSLFEVLEFTAVYKGVELYACNSGKHAANLLDTATEVVIADMRHRFKHKGDFIGLRISDYCIAFLDERCRHTAHDLTKVCIERTQAVLGHVVECTTVKTDAHGKARNEGSFRFDSLIFLHKDVQV